jgi:hypothetical protein
MRHSPRYQEVSSISQPYSSSPFELHGSLPGICIIVLLLSTAVGVIVRKKRRAYALRKQIEVLEKLWHINLTRDDC